MILDNLIKWDYLINLSNTITHQVMSLVLRSLQNVGKMVMMLLDTHFSSSLARNDILNCNLNVMCSIFHPFTSQILVMNLGLQTRKSVIHHGEIKNIFGNIKAFSS